MVWPFSTLILIKNGDLIKTFLFIDSKFVICFLETLYDRIGWIRCVRQGEDGLSLIIKRKLKPCAKALTVTKRGIDVYD